MNKKTLLRTFLLLLTVVFVLGMAISCNKDPADDENQPTDEPTPATDVITIAGGDAPEYQIVRSDIKGAGTPESSGVVAIRKALLEKTGVDLKLTTDWTGKGGNPEFEYEILIGETNREESATAMEKLAAAGTDYLFCTVGTKVCIVATSGRNLTFAVEAFINQITVENNVASVAKELNVSGMYVLPEGTYFEVAASKKSGADKYDEALALACLQGIMNRESPAKVYVNSGGGNNTWLETMQEEGRWLENVEFTKLSGFAELMEYGRPYVKAVVIWDESVAATVNVATTVAGVEDGIAMTQSYYQECKDLFNPDVKIIDLNTELIKYDGSITGSAKNDAYLWAIDNYLLKDRCSTDFLCHYMDAWNASGVSGRRDGGDDAYVSIRDWAVYNRAFVIDLSPWEDEAPLDDPDQEIGTDYKTFTTVLEYMMEKTADTAPYEMCGFFDFAKYSRHGANTSSKHETVPTEWEYVWVISHYNGYHNTCIEWSWNESFHSQYTGAQQLTSNRPEEYLDLEPNTTYLCFFMADYDSTYPLYRFLQDFWADPKRGELPLAWGINPSLLDTYPDIIEYYYDTATPNDYFTSDASCAGYINPSRIRDEFWDLMIDHNVKYFERADMTIAPMVLDQDRLDEQSLEAFYQFAYDGVATIIIDQHGKGGSQAPAGMYEDMPTDKLDNSFPTNSTDAAMRAVENVVRHGYNRTLGRKASGSSLSLMRCVWVGPSYICEVVDKYKAAHPDENVVVVDIYNYFNLLRQDLES